MKRFLLSVLVFASLPTLAADSDFAMTLQGILSSADSKSLSDMNRTLIVRLYANESSTNILWARSFAITLAPSGLFSVVLSEKSGAKPADGKTGSCASLLDAVLAAQSHEPWVGLQDDKTAGELTPRLRLSRQPRALRAYRAVSPAEGFTIGGKLTASSLTVTDSADVNDIRSSDIKVVNGVKALEALNVKSATVKKDVTIGGTATLNGGATVEDKLTVTTGGVTAPTAKVGTFTADTAEFASNVTVTVGGVGLDFPIGSITMWSGAADSIPAGWHICDGEENTPDLRDRFLVGVGGNYKLGDTGGHAFVKLETEHIPKHTHSFTYRRWYYRWATRDTDKTHAVDDNSKCRNQIDTHTDSAGGDTPHENRPPYYALYFIQRIK